MGAQIEASHLFISEWLVEGIASDARRRSPRSERGNQPTAKGPAP
jgi:hypothetical protein